MAEENERIFRASHRFARISASKARLVIDLIRGDPVDVALTKLRFSPKRASPMISKVVRSALANATQAAGLQGTDLVVWRAFVDGGPSWPARWKPRAQGRAYPRTRRTCHINVELRQAAKRRAAPPAQQGKAASEASAQGAAGAQKGAGS
ncbi:MAG: 50S ribosomal protein L22 [Planctomycetes bacterium]|nr:50S ribosomal protein L22 [Planctomycetota bacterium]